MSRLANNVKKSENWIKHYIFSLFYHSTYLDASDKLLRVCNRTWFRNFELHGNNFQWLMFFFLYWTWYAIPRIKKRKHTFFLMCWVIHQIRPSIQGEAEDSVILLLTKNPACSINIVPCQVRGFSFVAAMADS